MDEWRGGAARADGLGALDDKLMPPEGAVAEMPDCISCLSLSRHIDVCGLFERIRQVIRLDFYLQNRPDLLEEVANVGLCGVVRQS